MHKAPAQYLDDDATAGRLMAHARLLLKLTRRLEAATPSGLRHAVRVANFKSGRIVIHADNGAVATKIRQMSQRLVDELSKEGAECSGIEVKVQPRQIPFQSTPSTQKPLSAQAIGTLQSAAEELPDGPLRKALNCLLERAARLE